eukprot:4161542-Amphidinium_carterae.1
MVEISSKRTLAQSACGACSIWKSHLALDICSLFGFGFDRATQMCPETCPQPLCHESGGGLVHGRYTTAKTAFVEAMTERREAANMFIVISGIVFLTVVLMPAS